MFLVELVVVYKEIFGENCQKWPFLLCSTPLRLGLELCLGGGSFAYADPRQGFWYFLVFLGIAMLRLGEPLRLSVARHTSKLCFTCSLPLSITIVHWIKKNPNK